MGSECQSIQSAGFFQGGRGFCRPLQSSNFGPQTAHLSGFRPSRISPCLEPQLERIAVEESGDLEEAKAEVDEDTGPHQLHADDDPDQSLAVQAVLREIFTSSRRHALSSDDRTHSRR